MSSTFKPKFWRPSGAGGGPAVGNTTLDTERLNEFESQYEIAKFNPSGESSIDVQRQQLPIFKYRNQILYALETHRVLIIVGETGCGKSTQVPQYLIENGWTDSNHMICVTEPRRIASVNLAKRVADEKSCILGREVGYAIRFEDCFTEKVTRLKFVTDGLLIREMMQNPLLPQYSVIILDEVHERNVNTDIIIGLLKKVMRKRKDLRIIVCSATVDAEEIKLYFDEGLKKTKDDKAPTDDDSSLSSVIVSVEGRYFPVEINYLTEPCDNYIKAAVSTAIGIHVTEEQNEGDILIFLTGQDEVEDAVAQLIDRAKDLQEDKKRRDRMKKLWVLPLYGTLPASEQLKVFERTPRSTRKIIVSTNLAETSLTINGIVFVIDSGFMKLKAYDSKLGSESLITVAIAKSNANQRAGRAGRYRSGTAYRLYTEQEYLKLKDHTPPEMQRCDLAPVVLQLKALGVDNICRFDFLSSPPSNNLIDSLELMHALGALDHNSKLTTPLGYHMAEFPLHPIYSKALLNGETFSCTQEMLSIIALLQVQNVFVTPSGRKQAADKAKVKFACVEGDHLTLLNVYKCYREKLAKSKHGTVIRWCQDNFLNFKALQRATQIREQLTALLRKFRRRTDSTCGDKTEPILKCIASAFFVNIAKLHYSGDYKHLRSDLTLKVHPGSVINLYLANTDEPPPKYVIYNDIVQSKTHHLMRDLVVIDCNWLNELVPNYYEFGTVREINEKRLRIE